MTMGRLARLVLLCGLTFSVVGGSCLGAGANGGVNVLGPNCGSGTTQVNGVCVGQYGGIYKGSLSGQSLIVALRTTVAENHAVMLVVNGANVMTGVFFDNTATNTLVPVAGVMIPDGNIAGISVTTSWNVTQPGTGNVIQMTGTFKTGTAFPTASGTWSWIAGAYTGSGVWQTSIQ